MGVFESFRDDGWNTYYSELRTGVWADFSLVLVTYFSVVLGVVLLIIVIGTRGPQKWLTLLRLLLCLHTGVVILVCIVGRCWQVSHASVISDYSLGMSDTIEADVGIKVGLQKVNITLISHTELAGRKLRIDYNEELALHHGDAKQDFKNSLNRGLPWSIIYVMDYFQVDFGGLRWGRSIGEAGHFTSILLWSAFATWLMSNALLCIVLIRGLMFLSATGGLMIIACIVYHSLQPHKPLNIQFEGGLLCLTYGWSFWLCFVTGIITLIVGLGFLLLHWRHPSVVHEIYRVKKKRYSNKVEEISTQCSTLTSEPLQLNTPITQRRNQYRQWNLTRGRTNSAFDAEDFSEDDRFPPTAPSVENKSRIPMRETASCPDTIDRSHADTCVTVVAEINESTSSKSNSLTNSQSLTECDRSSFGDVIKFLAPQDSRDSLIEKSTTSHDDITRNILSNHDHLEQGSLRSRNGDCRTPNKRTSGGKDKSISARHSHDSKDRFVTSETTVARSYDDDWRYERETRARDSTSVYYSKSNQSDDTAIVIEALQDNTHKRIYRHSSADVPLEQTIELGRDVRHASIHRSNSCPTSHRHPPTGTHDACGTRLYSSSSLACTVRLEYMSTAD